MRLLGWILRGLLSALSRTLRWRLDDPAGALPQVQDTATIVAFWHNRILLMPALYRRLLPERAGVALVSASRDGEKLAHVLAAFGLRCVRGSTSRRGQQALVELTRLAQEGYLIGITPDGPRGPKYRVQDGVISLAQVSGALILPASWTASPKFVFRKAWDNFQVPLPFARVTLRLGTPMTVARDAEEAGREKKRMELENALRSLAQDEP